MTVGDLKKAIANLTDDADVVLVGYDRRTGSDVFRTTHQCANFQFQQSRNELWLSLEGLQFSTLMPR